MFSQLDDWANSRSGNWAWLSLSVSSDSGSLMRLQSKYWPGLGPHLRLEWGGIHIHTLWLLEDSVSCMLLDSGSHFHAGCQLEASPSLLPCGTLHMVGYFIKARKGERRERKSASKMKVIILHNVTAGVTSLLPYSGSKQGIGPSHMQERNSTRPWIPGGRDYLGVIVESIRNKKEMKEMTDFEYKEGKLREPTHRRWVLS